MFDMIKKRLLHFETDGDIMRDYAMSRKIKAARLRKVVHICFYTQSVLCMSSVIVGIIFADNRFQAVFSALSGLLAIAVAFIALGGGTSEKTASYIIDLVYAVVCFVIGGFMMYLCGGFMLAAAAAALVSFFADYFRRFLLSFSPLKLRRENYTLTQEASEIPAVLHKEEEKPAAPARSELMAVAESFMEILK